MIQARGTGIQLLRRRRAHLHRGARRARRRRWLVLTKWASTPGPVTATIFTGDLDQSASITRISTDRRESRRALPGKRRRRAAPAPFVTRDRRPPTPKASPASSPSRRRRSTTWAWPACSSSWTDRTWAARSRARPYSLPWDSRLVANGAHSVTALARDASGNQGTSVAVVVNVQQ